MGACHFSPQLNQNVFHCVFPLPISQHVKGLRVHLKGNHYSTVNASFVILENLKCDYKFGFI